MLCIVLLTVCLTYPIVSVIWINTLWSERVWYNIEYRIARNFRGRNFSQIGEKYNFRRENFHRLLAFAVPKVPRLQILRRKLLRIATKPWNLWKFSPSNISCCMVICSYTQAEPHLIHDGVCQLCQWPAVLTAGRNWALQATGGSTEKGEVSHR